MHLIESLMVLKILLVEEGFLNWKHDLENQSLKSDCGVGTCSMVTPCDSSTSQ
jgi:hypothetical protein